MASLTQVVNKAATTTTVVPSANPSVSGQSVTFTATVSVNSPGSAAVANPSGTVTFKDGLTTLGTGTLSTSGGVTTASFGNGTLSTASHSITASYGGRKSTPLNTSHVRISDALFCLDHPPL